MADPSAAPSPDEFAGLLAEAWRLGDAGLCLTDSDGVIRAVNPAFCRITGYAAAELMGVSLLRLQPPEAAVASSATHAAIMAGRAPDTVGSYLHKTGRVLFVRAADALLTGPSGQPYRLTSLVDLEEEAGRDARLERIRRAENFLATAATISNDFNNLLAIIMGYTAILEDNGADPRRVVAAAAGIDNAVQRAADLVRQTLFITRQAAPTLQRIHLNVLVEELARTLGSNDAWRPFVELDLDPGLAPASLDPRHLTHLVHELCRSVAEAMGRGLHIRLATSALEGGALQARFAHAREPRYVALEIRLTPPVPGASGGAEPPWERRRDLSLASAESIMAGHRGWFERESLPRDAVAFRLYFPMLPEPPASAGAAHRAGGEATVLVVDDEDPLLHALGYALERHGLRVLKARDGCEAVETFRRHCEAVTLVLCDLGLPGMSGWEAFMKMKEIRPGVRVLIMSGQLGPLIHDEIMRAGAVGFLQKPFAIAEAVNEVRLHLEGACGAG